MFDMLYDDPALLRGLLVFTVVFFIVGIASVPWLVGKIPRGYFLREKRSMRASFAHYGWPYLVATVARNLLGLILLVAGFLMLFLPGQGLLTLFLALLLIDFPGKYQIERWLIKKPAVADGLNWLRRRHGHVDIDIPD